MRSILSVVVGFAAWTVLWLAANRALTETLPEAFDERGVTENVGILALVLGLSVLFSVVAGFVCAAAARHHEMGHAWVLGALQLLVGIFVQLQYWNVMPLWYHVSFLALLVPGILLGARLRTGRRMTALPA